MKKVKLSFEAKKAILLGGMCSISYLAVYIVRNMLSAVSPQMIEGSSFTTEQIGSLSSVYFITYAVGQLINGFIGDRVKAKYMIGFGLVFAGVCNLLFTAFHSTPVTAYAAYATMGFFLSMIYGPMTRLVAENTELVYATRCSVGYNFASFFGSPLAGILATFLAWQNVFNVGTAMLIFMGVVCLTVFTSFEKRGLIKQKTYTKTERKGGGIVVLLKRQIVKFTLVSILTGVIRTTVVFWMPTYLSQRLGFSSDTAAIIFTAATTVISLNAFLAVGIYEWLHRNMDLTILIAFSASALFFLGVFFIQYSVLNIICLVMAIMSSNCAASMLWSRYCPSFADTGMVSTATGFLDFVSYIAASVSSTLFANAVTVIGWGNLILIWFGLMAVGVVVALPFKRNKKALNV